MKTLDPNCPRTQVIRTSPIAMILAIGMTSGAVSAQTEVNATHDSRIRTVLYSPTAVITIPVARGVATQIVMPEGETIVDAPAMGKGSDCRQPEHQWCVENSAEDISVKPKLGATSNSMNVKTTHLRYSFVLKVLPPNQELAAALRVSIVLPEVPTVAGPVVDEGPRPLSPQELIANRMRAEPKVRNMSYSVAVGKDSEDIVPVMVFDDGTQTYFSFPNNRPIPTVFQTSPDLSEEMVNVRMQGDLLVADRVARRFVLRLGGSVIAIINEAFDLDGVAPVDGTTVPGVERVMRTAGAGSQVSQ